MLDGWQGGIDSLVTVSGAFRIHSLHLTVLRASNRLSRAMVLCLENTILLCSLLHEAHSDDLSVTKIYL